MPLLVCVQPSLMVLKTKPCMLVDIVEESAKSDWNVSDIGSAELGQVVRYLLYIKVLLIQDRCEHVLQELVLFRKDEFTQHVVECCFQVNENICTAQMLLLCNLSMKAYCLHTRDSLL